MLSEILDLKLLTEQDGEVFNEKHNFRYSFSFYDVDTEDSIYDWFEEREYQGGGYSWNGVIYGLIVLNVPERLEDIWLDPEGDGIAVSCNDKSLLEQVLQWTSEARYNETLRLKAIEIAEKNGEME